MDQSMWRSRGRSRNQKHLTQSERSTRSTVDVFNTLHVFTREPIREQEIKLECMNERKWNESPENQQIKGILPDVE